MQTQPDVAAFPEAVEWLTERESVTSHEYAASGASIPYRAAAGKVIVREKDGSPLAAMFYTAYEAQTEDTGSRPITFFFNGGPGSASLWLNIGGFGPKRASTHTPQATPPAPYAWGENPHSLLPVTDMVFIDAIGTGYSRILPGVPTSKVWGVDQDVDMFAKAVQRFLTKRGTWNRPRFLFGESYGTTRAAALTMLLQNQGIDFNGVVLLSTLLNKSTSFSGSDQSYINLLPTYAATARYHGVATHPTEDLQEFLAAVREFALGEYSSALQAGDRLSRERMSSVAHTLSLFTGISEDELIRQRLRPEMEPFRDQLLAHEERKVGRFDSRFTADNSYVVGSGRRDPATDDAATAAVNSAHLAAYREHLTHDLEYHTDLPYLPLNNMEIAAEWDWRHKAPGIDERMNIPDVGYDLAAAIRRNEALKVNIMGGIYDLATPFFHAENDVAHMFLPLELRANVEFNWYESGHMTFVDEEIITHMRSDLESFYAEAVPHRVQRDM